MAIIRTCELGWPLCQDWFQYATEQPAYFIWIYATPAALILGIIAAITKPHIDPTVRRHQGKRYRINYRKGNPLIYWLAVLAIAAVLAFAIMISTNILDMR